jgi:molecular chaperone GrpE
MKRNKDELSKKDLEKNSEEIKAHNGDEIKELKIRAEEAEAKLNEVLHAKADFENARRRLEKEKEDFLKFANEAMITKLLPIVDNFRLAVNSMDDKHKIEDIATGIRLIEKQLEDTLKEFGLEPIDAVGKKFDPHLEEAVAHQETDEVEEDTVTEEIQRGYMLFGRLLRPAKVKVAKGKT